MFKKFITVIIVLSFSFESTGISYAQRVVSEDTLRPVASKLAGQANIISQDSINAHISQLHELRHDIQNRFFAFIGPIHASKTKGLTDSRIEKICGQIDIIEAVLNKIPKKGCSKTELDEYLDELKQTAVNAIEAVDFEVAQAGLGQIVKRLPPIWGFTERSTIYDTGIGGLRYGMSLLCSYFEDKLPVKRRVKLNDILDAATTVRTLIYENNQKFYNAGDVELVTDDTALMRAISNIAINAQEAMDKDNDVFSITTRLVDGDKAVEIILSDTGAGIPEDILPYVFDRGTTTKRGIGHGIGLAIAKDCVEKRCGGTISVDSELGKGTTFTIRLLIADSSPKTSSSGEELSELDAIMIDVLQKKPLEDIRKNILNYCKKGDYSWLRIDWSMRYQDYQAFIKHLAAVNSVISELGMNNDFCREHPDFVTAAIESRCSMMENYAAPLSESGKNFISDARKAQVDTAIMILAELIKPLQRDIDDRNQVLISRWFMPLFGDKQRQGMFQSLNANQGGITTQLLLTSGCSKQCDHCWLSTPFCVYSFPWVWKIEMKNTDIDFHAWLSERHSDPFRDYYDFIFDRDAFDYFESLSLRYSHLTSGIVKGSVAERGLNRSGSVTLDISWAPNTEDRQRHIAGQDIFEGIIHSDCGVIIGYPLRREDDPWPLGWISDDSINGSVKGRVIRWGRLSELERAGVKFIAPDGVSNDYSGLEEKHKGEILLLPNGSVVQIQGFDNEMQSTIFKEIISPVKGTPHLCHRCDIECPIRIRAFENKGLTSNGGFTGDSSPETRSSGLIDDMIEEMQDRVIGSPVSGTTTPVTAIPISNLSLTFITAIESAA
jgi:signal transduction histidine kinase